MKDVIVTGSDVIDYFVVVLVQMLLTQLVTDYVTDVMVTRSDVIDHMIILISGLMLSHYL